MSWITLDHSIGFITIAAIASCIIAGLILTFATSGGINAGAIPFTIGGCIIMCITLVYGVIKCLDYCEIE